MKNQKNISEKKIHSEFYFIILIIKSILFFPFRLFLFFIGKRKFSEILKQPANECWKFFWEAKFTAIIIGINILFFIFILVSPIFIKDFGAFSKNYLLDGPQNIINLNFIPFFVNWFVHFNLFHLLGNIFFLFIFGRIVEQKLKAKNTAMVYFGSAITSGILDNLIHFNDLNYYANGASGAIAGLLAIAILINPFRFSLAFYIPLPIFLIGWLYLYNEIIGIFKPVEGVAHWAHIGGFLIISFIGFFLNKENRKKLKKGFFINLILIIITILIYFLLIK